MISSWSIAARSGRSPSTLNPQTKTSNYWNSIDLFRHNSTLSHHWSSIWSLISNLGTQEHPRTLSFCIQLQVSPTGIKIHHILQISIEMASSLSNSFKAELYKLMLNFTKYPSPWHQYQSNNYWPFHEPLLWQLPHFFSPGECSYNIYFFPVIGSDE